MTSIEDSHIYYSSKQLRSSAANQTFNCRVDMDLEHEEQDQQVEATSTESPNSKDSWTAPSTEDSEQHVHASNQGSCQKPTNLSYNLKNGENYALSADTEINVDDSNSAKDQQLTEDIHMSAAVEDDSVKCQQQSLSPHSSDIVNTFDSANSKAIENPICLNNASGDMEGSSFVDDDDDFGDFEGAELQATVLPPGTDEKDDDGFGDFTNGPCQSTLPGSMSLSMQSVTTLASSSSSSPPPSVPQQLTELKGIEFTAAAKSFLGEIVLEKPQLPRGLQMQSTLRDARLNVCCESRLGNYMLYPRPMPAGFLRSSGRPVILPSKITRTEQRLLSRLGLLDLYTRAQQSIVSAEQMATQGDLTVVSSITTSSTEEPLNNAFSDGQKTQQDMSLDLDFLVQLSGQQQALSVVSSGTEGDSVQFEDVARHRSNLHNLFEGLVVESSQSSFVSQSSGPLDFRPKNVNESIISKQETTSKEATDDDNDWDVFVEAKQPAVEETTVQDPVLHHAKADSDEHDRTDVTDPTALVVDSHSDEKREEQSVEADIFSGEWLNQLRSVHGSAEERPCSSETTTNVTRPLDAEWGDFASAASCQISADHTDPFQTIALVDSEIRQFQKEERTTSKLHHEPISTGLAVPMAMPLQSAGNALNCMATDLTCIPKGQVPGGVLAIDDNLLLQSVAERDGPDDDEWGGFQG